VIWPSSSTKRAFLKSRFNGTVFRFASRAIRRRPGERANDGGVGRPCTRRARGSGGRLHRPQTASRPRRVADGGIAYLGSAPGGRPFIEVGAQVKTGETLIIIEAMKTMNQIPAPRSGTVIQILVEDGQPVEYGEPLMIIE